MRLAEAKALQPGTVIFHKLWRNADKSPQRWRVCGNAHTWVRSPERVHIPIRRGLYEHGSLHEGNLEWFTLCEEEAR